MTDRIEGQNINGESLWTAEKLPTVDENLAWFGTGQAIPGILRFTNVRQIIDYFIGFYPGTTIINAYIENEYANVDLSRAARVALVDGVVSILPKGGKK